MCNGHCEKVYEVKGMTEPKDIPLEPVEWTNIKDKTTNAVLICVYHLLFLWYLLHAFVFYLLPLPPASMVWIHLLTQSI